VNTTKVAHKGWKWYKSRRTITNYKFGKKDELNIQYHPKGHKFQDGKNIDRGHYNNHPATKNHYGILI
jgi:hypothetical protein